MDDNSPRYKSFTQKLSFLLLLTLVLSMAPQLVLAKEKQVIRFGVLSIAQPSRIFAKWQPFADYMSQELGQPVEIVVPRGFGKMKKTIADGNVDFFILTPMFFIV